MPVAVVRTPWRGRARHPRLRGEMAVTHRASGAPPAVGRWEWRTFGPDLGQAARRLTMLPTEHVRDSDEVYVLSPLSDASVKVRDGLLDVKELQRVRPDGLEQWLPVLKVPLPIDSRAAHRVLAALGVDAWLDEPPVTVQALAAVAPGLRVVAVHKRRRHYTLGGCMAELTEIAVAGSRAQTIAVEAEDPALVGSTVLALGLGGRENVSVARGIKALAGFGAERVAVIDVGTNSVKFLLAERAADGWRTLADRAEVTRLGQDLDRAGRLGKAPIERTAEVVSGMAADAVRAGAADVVAVGTAGLRAAPNAEAFLAAVRDRGGPEVEVIDGEEEARLAYLAATSGLAAGSGSLIVFDSGGGSTQFTFGGPGHVSERFSLPVGAVRFTERFGLDGRASEEAVAGAIAAIRAELSRLGGRDAPELLIGMGGAVTNLAAVMHGLAEYDPDAVQGTVLDRLEIDRQIEIYRTCTARERREITGLQPNRAEVILAGACIVRTVLALLGAGSLTVSDRALRHGLLADRFSLV
jgi:exopolyphosphatase/guanosine-5'-triphosphate,3'-diphosphate pyrophosphatase